MQTRRADFARIRALLFNLHSGNPSTMTRQERQTELKGLLASHVGRNQLTALLRQYMNIPKGQIPLGTPFVQTILDHEFAEGRVAQATS
jgi:hypothetical protein